MSVRATDDDAIALYDSVTGLPLPMEVFTSDEDVEQFLEWYQEKSDVDLRYMSRTGLAELRKIWRAEPVRTTE